MTTRTVIHDGHHDDEIEQLAREHGALRCAFGEDGSWTVIDAMGSVHTLRRGMCLRGVAFSRRRRYLEVVIPPRARVHWDRGWGWWVGSRVCDDGSVQVLAFADSQPECLRLTREALAEQAEVSA